MLGHFLLTDFFLLFLKCLEDNKVERFGLVMICTIRKKSYSSKVVFKMYLIFELAIYFINLKHTGNLYYTVTKDHTNKVLHVSESDKIVLITIILNCHNINKYI